MCRFLDGLRLLANYSLPILTTWELRNSTVKTQLKIVFVTAINHYIISTTNTLNNRNRQGGSKSIGQGIKT